MTSPSVNKKNKDFKELIQVESSFQFSSMVEAKSRGEISAAAGGGQREMKPISNTCDSHDS